MTATKQQPIAGYRISDPSDPELGFWFSETPCAEGYTSEPLYAGAAPAAVTPLPAVLEQIAQGWDGCKYDAPGETLDIGADIRAAAARLLAEQPEAVAIPGSIPKELTRLADIMRDCGRLVSTSGNAEQILRTAATLLSAPTAPALEAPAAPAVHAALQRLEDACDARAALTTSEAYNMLILLPGMQDALQELDEARGQACAALAAAPQAPVDAQEPVANLHDDGYWTPTKTEAGRALNELLMRAGSPRIPVYTHPAPQQAAPQAPAALDELGKISEIAACWGCDHPDAPGDTETVRRVKWVARQLRAVSLAPAAPVGWVTVPRKITDSMIEAALAAHYGKKRLAAAGGAGGIDMTVDDTNYSGADAMRRMWCGALAAIGTQAAPAAPAVDAPAPASEWRDIFTAEKSDDLIWLYDANSKTIDGPRTFGTYDVEEYTHWAPAEAPDLDGVDEAFAAAIAAQAKEGGEACA